MNRELTFTKTELRGAFIQMELDVDGLDKALAALVQARRTAAQFRAKAQREHNKMLIEAGRKALAAKQPY